MSIMPSVRGSEGKYLYQDNQPEGLSVLTQTHEPLASYTYSEIRTVFFRFALEHQIGEGWTSALLTRLSCELLGPASHI